jgi:multidrug efflux system membrane fusion protein
VDIQPHIEGEIVELWAVEGQMVTAGDPLFRLDDREIRARIARSEAILARDRARLARAVEGLETIRKLVDKAAASQSQADQSAAEVEILAADAAASEASLLLDTIALDHATVRAPIDGRIGAISISRGSFVGGREALGDPPLTITRMQPVAVSFALPDRDLDLLRATLEGDLERERVQVFSSGSDQRLGAGPITFMDSAFDPKSGTILVRALLANKDGGLWLGQYVRVSVDLGIHREVVTVPMAAVMYGDKDPSIFVVGQDGKAERRLVEIGGTRGERAVITSGLEAGERVVVEGQWRLHEGASVSGGAEHPVDVADREAGSGGRGRQ